MTGERDRIESALGAPLPDDMTDAMIADAARLAEAAAAAARAAAARLPAPRDPDGFLQVLESLAGDDSQGGNGG